MGNGPARGWPPPTGVVTIVLAGGRTEEHQKPILAGDIMLRHPRHHVVRPDFFRSSPVVVLRAEEVLMPGHKFFLVPFHTVYKKLNKRVDVLHRTSSTSSSAAPPEGTIRDINCCRHGSNCTQCSVKIGKKGLARAMAGTRSPAAVRAAVLRKSSPTTSLLLQARKTLLHKELTRNSRRRQSVDGCDYARRRALVRSQMGRHSTSNSSARSSTELTERDGCDYARRRSSLRSQMGRQSTSNSSARSSTELTERDGCDYARRRASLRSQMGRHSTSNSSARSSAEFAVNKPLDSADLAVLESFTPADFAECKAIESPVTKQATSSDLSIPEYESFQKFSGELLFEPTVPAGKEHESVEAKTAIEPLLQQSATSVKKLVQSFEAMDSTTSKKSSPIALIFSKKVTSAEEPEWFEAMDYSVMEKNSSEPQWPMPTPVPNGDTSAHAMKERMNSRGGDSGLDHRTKEDISRFNKPPRSPLLLEWEFMQKKVAIDIAGEPQQAISHSGRQNSPRQQPTSGENLVICQEPERTSTGKSEQRAPQQQRQMGDQGGDLKELQQIFKGAGNNKFVVRPLDKGLLSKSPQVESKPATPALTPALTPVQVKISSVTLVKQRKPYRQKLIEHLCFSSAQYLQSPLHVQAAGGNPEKQMKAHRLKLRDHLKLEPSPPPQYLQKLFQQSPINVQAAAKVNNSQLNNSPLRPYKLPLPIPQSSSGSKMDPKAQKDLVAFQLTQAVKNQWDPSVLRPNTVNQTGQTQWDPSVLRPNIVNQTGTTAIEEKFLKVPPVGFFRHRRIRTRRRIHTLANWKPKLSPLVEFSP